jgi:hypothetical protein
MLMLDGADQVHSTVRHQLSICTAGKRELTGVGFYRDSVFADDAPITRDLPDETLCNVIAEHPDLECGAMFVLSLRGGVVSFLEGVTFDGPWPAAEDSFTFFLDQSAGQHL